MESSSWEYSWNISDDESFSGSLASCFMVTWSQLFKSVLSSSPNLFSYTFKSRYIFKKGVIIGISFARSQINN
ncbi:hypothetical protein BpHYR1_044439 [Brachionus plicatilis]|uniref:Uncharacterized protein n=1 Tax=Brachionus plicatilis TaxID=10195 RepID=A0A3M7PZU6_BRAPC|nr:hypothetical protein BpHYR1_044439 [Brachionus plicatilis]